MTVVSLLCLMFPFPSGSLPATDQKFIDPFMSANYMDNVGTILHLDIIPVGNGVSAREGKAFSVDSLQIRGSVFASSVGTVAMGAVYYVWDHQPNKGLPAVTDVLDSVSPYSFIKRENASRFRIIGQRHYSVLGNSGAPKTTAGSYPVEEYIRLPRSSCIATTTLLDTTGVIGNRVTGALYLVLVGDQASGVNSPAYLVNVRITFSDI